METNEEVEEIPTYKIAEEKLDWFKTKFEKLVRRAIKIGCEIPSYEVLGDTKIKVNKNLYIPGVIVRVFGKAPKINGWDIIGAIEHLPEGNILKTIGKDTQNFAQQYTNIDCDCEHCHVKRKRSQTFIVKNEESGILKQVGSTCLRDFLGHSSPETIVAIASMFADLFETCEELEKEFFRGTGSNFAYGINEYLLFVYETIKTNGWVSRSKADETTPATCDLAYISVRDSKSNYFEESEDEDAKKHVLAAIEWASNLSDEECVTNDYYHNLRLFARRGLVERKYIGYIASILPAYDRVLSEAVKKKMTQTVSEYVGNVGDKVELQDVTLFHVTHYDNNFRFGSGVTTLSLFKNQSGNVFKWAGKGFEEEEFKVGETKTMWATIKAHEEYKGTKQTVLTRCVVKPPGWAKKSKK